jgi:hypothetical protein
MEQKSELFGIRSKPNTDQVKKSEKLGNFQEIPECYEIVCAALR